MKNLLLISALLFITISSQAQKTWIDKDTVKTCYSCRQYTTTEVNATFSYDNGRSARLPYSDHLALPTKYQKYRIHIKNNCHWALASKTKWIAGYVVTIGPYIAYFDYKGVELNPACVKILGYDKLKFYH